MRTESFVIASRFRGPPQSGNGGYVCGRIAKPLQGPVVVRLKAPPPLDTEVRLESDESSARLFHGDTVVGEARRVDHAQTPRPAPSYASAQLASRSFTGFQTHRFPGCFVCGPQRKEGDGLRIFPGPLQDGEVLAACWVPDASLADEGGHIASEFIWCALDCPSAFAVFPLPDGVAIVLGELCASIFRDLRPDDRCVVTAWALGAEGRKRFAASAVHTDEGQLVAIARATWIEVPASAWNAA